MRRLLAIAVAVWLAPIAAWGATWSVNVTSAIDLGSIAAATSGDTTFRVSSSTGSVTVVGGSGRRLSAGSARVQVNISCRPGRGVDNACLTTNVPIRIGTIGGLTGRARAFTGFNVTMGTAVLLSGPTGSVPYDFLLAPLGNNSVKTFFVGADYPVAGDDSGLPSGAGDNGFYVYALDGNGQSLAGDSDKGEIVVYRSLAVAATSNLSFGRIQIPSSGSSTIALNASNGNRTVSGNAVGYPTPAPTRGAFTITGEGGQQVSLTVPSTVQLTGPGTLNVTVTDTAPNTPNLSGSLGAAGSYSFNVGGSFQITPTTPTGAYTGVLTVSVDYN